MRVRRLALSALCQLGGFRLLELLLGSGGIVAYHAVVDDDFFPEIHLRPTQLSEQLEFLAARYALVSLRELLHRRAAGRSTNRCVAVTFDDGYRDLGTHALPVLERLGIPATVFVVAEAATTGAPYWWDRMAWVRGRAVAGGWQDIAWTLGLSAVEAQSIEVVRHTVLAQGGHLAAATALALGRVEAACGQVPLRPCTFAELAALSRSELLDFGCHTVTHPALPLLPPAEQVREIASGYRTVRDRLPRALAVVAYPYGLYDHATTAAARAAGMSAGVTMSGRALGPTDGAYTIPRIGVAAVNTLTSLRFRLARATAPALTWRDGYHPKLPAHASGGW